MSANKQVGRDFFLDATDERKGRNEKMEMGEKKQEEKKRGRHEEKEGELLERLSRPSLHYITEMLQH